MLGLFTPVNPIMFTPKHLPQTGSWFVPILIAGIPISDATLVVFSRIRRKKRVCQAGLAHTFHRLVDLGMPAPHAAKLLHLASLILGFLGLFTLTLPQVYGMAIFLGTLVVGVGLMLYLDARKRFP